MKKLAYAFGFIGFFAIFVLCTFELILMSVNSYGLDTIISLYIFFIINIIGIVLLTVTYLSDRQSNIYKLSFNLNNRAIALIYLGIPIFSVILLIFSNCYNINTDNPLLLAQGFLESPELYLPIIPVLISSVFFALNSSKSVQKYSQLKKMEGSRI